MHETSQPSTIDRRTFTVRGAEPGTLMLMGSGLLLVVRLARQGGRPAGSRV